MLHARPSEAMSDLDPPTGFHSRNIIHFLFASLPPSLPPSFRLSLRRCVGRRRFSPSSERARTASDFFGHDESRTVVNHVQERAEKFTIPMEAFPLSLAEILPRTV